MHIWIRRLLGNISVFIYMCGAASPNAGVMFLKVFSTRFLVRKDFALLYALINQRSVLSQILHKSWDASTGNLPRTQVVQARSISDVYLRLSTIFIGKDFHSSAATQGLPWAEGSCIMDTKLRWPGRSCGVKNKGWSVLAVLMTGLYRFKYEGSSYEY